MNINDLKQSKFLTQKEVDPPKLVTIKSCNQVDVAREGADPELRWALSFHELDKPMTLNSTNGQILAAIFGSDESDDWIGHKIVLYRDPNVSFGGKLVGGIRCRAMRKAGPANVPEPDPEITNPDYVGDDPPPPPGDGVPF